MPCGTKRSLRRTLRGCIDFLRVSLRYISCRQVIWRIVLPKKVRTWQIYVLLFAVALFGRVAVAHFLANDEDQDGDLYAQIASNVLEHHIYSRDTDPPLAPTFVRLPGYPLFIAGVYALFGHGNNEALFFVQGVLDTLTCVLIAMLAWLWSPREGQNRRAALGAFLLAAACPFTTIYSAVLLTETMTMFLSVAMVVAATFAFSHPSPKVATMWWVVAGLLAGAVQLFRPDAGLFAAAIGLTMVGYAFIRLRAGEGNAARQFKAVLRQGGIFSFSLSLWSSCPGQSEMHVSSTSSSLWRLSIATCQESSCRKATSHGSVHGLTPSGILRLSIGDSVPTNQWILMMFPRRHLTQEVNGKAWPSSSIAIIIPKWIDKIRRQQRLARDPMMKRSHAAMTPDIDAGFAQIARQRIAHAPLRYYVWLPIKRAIALWFVPHAQYYPFQGELFPLDEMDHENHQDLWLPIFFLLTLIYTIAGRCRSMAFMEVTYRVARMDAIRWLLLAAFLILPRWIYMATLEHTEPRYVVEFFPFLSVLGGIAISCFFGAN